MGEVKSVAKACLQDKMQVQEIRNLMKTSERAGHSVAIYLPGYDGGVDDSLEVKWHAIFFYPDSLFLQVDIPFPLRLRNIFEAVSDPLQRKQLLIRFRQEFGVDRGLITMLMYL